MRCGAEDEQQSHQPVTLDIARAALVGTAIFQEYSMDTKKWIEHPGVGKGWQREIILPLLCLFDLVPEADILQIKEKFGLLRIYMTGPAWLITMVNFVEQVSVNCCEDCGGWQNCAYDMMMPLKVTTAAVKPGHWIRTLCQGCRAKEMARYEEEHAKYHDHIVKDEIEHHGGIA